MAPSLVLRCVVRRFEGVQAGQGLNRSRVRRVERVQHW